MLRVVTWNTLYPDYGVATAFPYCSLDELQWATRLSKILIELQRIDADIGCLQEIDATTVQADFIEPLAVLGYACTCQLTPKKQRLLAAWQPENSTPKPHAMINLTFFRAARFTLQAHKVHSRFMTTTLQDCDSAIVQVCNIHLPSKSTATDQQRYLAILLAQDMLPHTTPLLLGDFNTHDGDQQVVAEFLTAHGFQNAPTCGLTFKTPYLQGVFDYVWFRSHYAVKTMHRYVEPDALPSKRWPSDHLPVVVDLQLCKNTAT